MKKLLFTCALVASMGIVAAPPQKPQQRKAPPPRQVAARPAPKQAARPAPKPVARPAARPAPKPIARPAARPAPKPVHHTPPKSFSASHHKMGMRGAGVWSTPPHHTGFHANRPHGARFWGRPAIPPLMAGALYAWQWIATPWNYTIDGAYYYGEGYYFDGYNYCYNGGYHLTPPPVIVTTPVVTTPVVTTPVVTTPVVTQPVVTQPVVAQPVVVPPPPPPPRRRGLLNILFGD